MTIQIKKNQLTQIALTLKEKANLNNDLIWLFRFVSEQSKKEFFCNLLDLSVAQDRYNLFNLYEGTSIELSEGDYTYYVYQMPEENNNNFSIGLLCEIGKAQVKGINQNINTFNNTTTIINIYE